jgi:hypothetical protein
VFKSRQKIVSRETFLDQLQNKPQHVDLLANTEVIENDIEQIFDIDPPGDPPQRPRGNP